MTSPRSERAEGARKRPILILGAESGTLRDRMWRWYGVKTLYRTRAIGPPSDPDEHYDPDSTMLEERIVVFRARSFDDAIRKGELEAEAYANGRETPAGGKRRAEIRNPYHQRLSTRFLGAIDAFELFEPPGAGVEVFSSTSLVSKGTSDSALVDARFGQEERHLGARTKFLDGRLTGKLWWSTGMTAPPSIRGTKKGKGRRTRTLKLTGKQPAR